MMKTKMIILCLFTLYWGIGNLSAQAGIVTAGGTASGIGGSLSYSFGQLGYIPVKDAGGTMNAGVQQPYEIFVVSGINETGIKLIPFSVFVFPNPVTEFVILKLENYNAESISYQLFDIHGKILVDKKVDSNETKLSMTEFAAASYFLKISNNSEPVKTFKIIKN